MMALVKANCGKNCKKKKDIGHTEFCSLLIEIEQNLL